MKKSIRFWAFALIGLLISGMLAACGDNTATTGTVATTAAASAAAATTAATAATTAATAATTAATAATTAATAATTAAGTTATTAAAAAGGAGGTIRIYSSLPRTGSSKAQTDTMVKAFQLALDDYTKGTKKVGNFTIDYQDLDDATAAKGQWDADQEKANANKASNDPDTMVYLGTFNSGAAVVSIPIMNRAGIAMISPSNTNTCLTVYDAGSGCDQKEPGQYYPTGQRNYFRLAGRDDLQGFAIANFMKSQNVKKVFVIDDSQVYGKGLADGFTTAVKSLGGIELVDRASIGGKESDYKSLATTIKSKAPDAIFFGGIVQQQADKLIADVKAAGIKAPMYGGEGILEDSFIKGAGVAAEGTYASVAGALEKDLGPKAQDFYKRYRAKYGNTEAYTIFAYELMTVALTAIEKAGKKDRAAVVQALTNLGQFDGVLGKWTFDKNGDISLGTFVINQVKDGKWVEFTQVNVQKPS